MSWGTLSLHSVVVRLWRPGQYAISFLKKAKKPLPSTGVPRQILRDARAGMTKWKELSY